MKKLAGVVLAIAFVFAWSVSASAEPVYPGLPPYNDGAVIVDLGVPLDAPIGSWSKLSGAFSNVVNNVVLPVSGASSSIFYSRVEPLVGAGAFVDSAMPGLADVRTEHIIYYGRMTAQGGGRLYFGSNRMNGGQATFLLPDWEPGDMVAIKDVQSFCPDFEDDRYQVHMDVSIAFTDWDGATVQEYSIVYVGTPTGVVHADDYTAGVAIPEGAENVAVRIRFDMLFPHSGYEFSVSGVPYFALGKLLVVREQEPDPDGEWKEEQRGFWQKLWDFLTGMKSSIDGDGHTIPQVETTDDERLNVTLPEVTMPEIEIVNLIDFWEHLAETSYGRALFGIVAFGTIVGVAGFASRRKERG